MKIQVCTGKTCKSRFSEYILKRIQADTQKFQLENIELESCPCLGQCKTGPNVFFDGKIENFSDPAKISRMMFERLQQRKNNKK